MNSAFIKSVRLTPNAYLIVRCHVGDDCRRWSLGVGGWYGDVCRRWSLGVGGWYGDVCRRWSLGVGGWYGDVCRGWCLGVGGWYGDVCRRWCLGVGGWYGDVGSISGAPCRGVTACGYGGVHRGVHLVPVVVL